MTVPIVSKPARPARPPIWWNSRALRMRVDVPSYLARAVKTTVRIGTLMPTPRVSVPQMTLSSPACANRSTRRRYLGSIPAWWTPMPWRTNLASVLPNPAAKRNPPTSSAISSFSARVSRLTLISDCARSTADGLGEVHDVHRGLVGGQQLLEHLGERRHPEVVHEGDGAGGRADHGDGPAGALGQVSVNRVTSPSVADISTNWASGSSSSGTCQAQPRGRVGEVVELVHDDLADVGVAALPQGEVGEDLRGAADDRGVGVDLASPVSMPTLSAPKVADRSKNFSDTRALMGAV
jgi:hypothetical protein